jgi:hypothetical protein
VGRRQRGGVGAPGRGGHLAGRLAARRLGRQRLLLQVPPRRQARLPVGDRLPRVRLHDTGRSSSACAAGTSGTCLAVHALCSLRYQYPLDWFRGHLYLHAGADVRVKADPGLCDVCFIPSWTSAPAYDICAMCQAPHMRMRLPHSVTISWCSLCVEAAEMATPGPC